MSVLPFVVLIGFLGAVSGLKCYAGSQYGMETITCKKDNQACINITTTLMEISVFSCSSKTICEAKPPLANVVKKCCNTDLCNSAVNIPFCNNTVNIPLSNNSVNIPFSNILMILTMSLSVMLTYIM